MTRLDAIRRAVAIGALLATRLLAAPSVAGQAAPTARPPRGPTGITVSGAAGAVTVSWTAVGTGLHYLILRGASAVVPPAELGRSAALSFVDTTARAGRTWFYYVVALRANGARDTSAVVAYTVPAPTPPKRRPAIDSRPNRGRTPLSGETVP